MTVDGSCQTCVYKIWRMNNKNLLSIQKYSFGLFDFEYIITTANLLRLIDVVIILVELSFCIHISVYSRALYCHHGHWPYARPIWKIESETFQMGIWLLRSLCTHLLVSLHIAAIAQLAWMRINARMFDHMHIEFWCTCKSFIAKLTSFWQFTRVGSSMHGQMGNMFVGFITKWAFVRSWIRMPLNMQTKRALMNELLSANVAREIRFFRVNDNMMIEQRFGTESFITILTCKFQIDAMRCLMSTMTTKWTQHFSTFVTHMLGVLASDVSLQRRLTATFCITNFTEKMNGSQMLL